MVCIYCANKTTVANSRTQKRSNQTWRRRLCTQCGAVFTTLESVDYIGSLSVRYKDGSLEPFRRDILFISINAACGHRKDSIRAASALTATIISRLIPKIRNAVVLRDDITEAATITLKRFDRAASVQYSAYHPLQ